MSKSILLFILIMMTAISAQAEWSEPVRVSWGYPLLIRPRAVTIGDTIHVVAHEADMDVYYMMSPDNGETWSEPASPCRVPGRSPDIAYSNGYLHIVFYSFPYGMRHVSSSDGGRHWSDFHFVAESASGPPRITAQGDTLFACSTDHEPMRFIASSSFDNGLTWNDPVIVESDPIWIGQPPDIFYSMGRLHYIYQMGTDDSVGSEIYYRYSDDYGLTWSERTYLSTPEGTPYAEHSQQPSGYANSDGEIIATWMDYKYGSRCTGFDGEILGRISTDNGNTWLPETRISRTQSSNWPSPLIADNSLYCVWQDDYTFGYCGWSKIMYAKSHDWGNSWSEPIVISGDDRLVEEFPYLCYNIVDEEPNLHCLYSIGASGGVWHILGYDEYTDIEEDNGDSVIPDMFTIGAYPNPFNSSVTLTLNNPRGGDIEVVIYNLYGQEVKRFQAHGGKEVKIGWDATDAMGNELSSGIYFARARTSQQSQIIKLTYLK